MKNKITIALLIIIAILLGINYCQKSSIPEFPDSSKQVASARKIEKEIHWLKLASDTIYKERIKYVTKYKKIRHDSLIPCEEKLLICDTILIKDSVLIASKDTIIRKYEMLTDTLWKVHSIDSLTIIGQKKQIKKLKRRVWFWKVTTFISSGLNGYQAVKG